MQKLSAEGGTLEQWTSLYYFRKHILKSQYKNFAGQDFPFVRRLNSFCWQQKFGVKSL